VSDPHNKGGRKRKKSKEGRSRGQADEVGIEIRGGKNPPSREKKKGDECEGNRKLLERKERFLRRRHAPGKEKILKGG